MSNEVATIQELTPIPDYIRWLKRTRSKAYEVYFYAFKLYAKWLREKKGVNVDVSTLKLKDFSPDLVEEHYTWIRNYHTASRFLSAVRGLFNYVKNRAPYTSFADVVWLDRMIGAINMIRRRKEAQRFSVGALTLREVAELLLGAIEVNEFLYHSLIILMYTGSRISEIARKYVKAKFSVDEVDDVVRELGTAIVDLKKCLMVIPIAKSEGKFRVLPIKPVKESVKFYIDEFDKVVKFKVAEKRKWFNKSLSTLCKQLGMRKVRLHDLRRTTKTHLEMLPVKDWEVNYWIGHVVRWEQVSNRYRDRKVLLDKIYRDIVYSDEEKICPKCLNVFPQGDSCPVCGVRLTRWKHYLLRVLLGLI
ncbi:MAG: hypothetical protein L3J47_11655 [Sulfurovum sp.]|nr:hypothetical protein [Sulfurovum sp.]